MSFTFMLFIKVNFFCQGLKSLSSTLFCILIFRNFFTVIWSFIFFSSFLNSYKNSSCNLNEDILCLVFDFFALVNISGVGSIAIDGVSSRDHFLPHIFIGSNLLLKLLETFFLALKHYPKLIIKKPFLKCLDNVIQIF